ncbi:GH13038 [Drosophila grimshawi]|uniref:GH13038 n=1 Tax=Drosophila grimshawi TaxID=7222 RepID=B4K1L9_DROGR|nr:GH13038 [Drosophila grimshawi]
MDKNRKLLMKYKEVIDTLDFSEDDDSDSAVNKLMDDGAAHPETELAKKPLPLGSLLTSEECKAIGYCDLSGCSDGEPVISVGGVEVGVSGSMLRQKNAPEMLDSDWKVVGKKNRSSHLSAVVGVKRKVVPMSLKTKANVQPASKRRGHATTTCSKGKEIEATCANCKGSHVASYKGCPVYKAARDRLLSSRAAVHGGLVKPFQRSAVSKSADVAIPPPIKQQKQYQQAVVQRKGIIKKFVGQPVVKPAIRPVEEPIKQPVRQPVRQHVNQPAKRQVENSVKKTEMEAIKHTVKPQQQKQQPPSLKQMHKQQTDGMQSCLTCSQVAQGLSAPIRERNPAMKHLQAFQRRFHIEQQQQKIQQQQRQQQQLKPSQQQCQNCKQCDGQADSSFMLALQQNTMMIGEMGKKMDTLLNILLSIVSSNTSNQQSLAFAAVPFSNQAALTPDCLVSNANDIADV